jgi:predicted AAA+ superfamily ATPase
MASNGGLINRAQCKKFALRWAQENRKGWSANRVSKQFLDDLETKVRITIQSAIKRHPSVGQTIKDLS